METTTYRGFNINILQDEDPINPRTEQDHLGTMVCWHNRYDLGDKHNFDTEEDFKEWAEGQDLFIFPLYLYDHSGITISTRPFHCSWDSGQVGWIYMTKEKFRKECTRPGKPEADGICHTWYPIKHITRKDRERAMNILQEEVDVYDLYLTGQVYGYQVEPVEANKGINCNESCWGFYGDVGVKDAVDVAKRDIDHEIKKYKQTVTARVALEKEANKFVNNHFAL